MKHSKVLRGAVLASAVAALAACSSSGGSPAGSSTSAGEPQAGGDLVLARADDVTSLIPSVPTDNASIWTMEEIYSTLAVPSEDGKTVLPSLATSWKQSSDKLSWTFNLRKDAKFSDGNPVTAGDVKFSIQQNQKPDAPFAFIDEIISKIDTPNDHTVVIHTKKPWAPLPADMALYANSVVPKDYGGKTQQQFDKNPVGSGPFKFASWSKGSSLKLVKNPHYWDKKVPYLDSVTFTVVPDGNTRGTQLASNQIQINQAPAYSSIKALQAQSNVKVTAFPSSEVDYFAMNTTHKPFDDLSVRKAISLAIDKQAILKAVLYGHGQVAGAYLSPVTWAHDSTIKPVQADVAAAKAALAKSSAPNGFSTSITVASGDQDASTEAQLIQSDLAKIGIKVKINTIDPAAVVTARHAGNFDLLLGLYTTDIVDPDEIARFAGTYDGGVHTIYTGFKSAKMDKLAEKASSVSSQSERKKAYDQMQQIIADQVPYIPLYYAPGVFSYSNKVQGFHPGGTGNYFLEKVWISK